MPYLRLSVRFTVLIVWTAFIAVLRVTVWPSVLFNERLDRWLRRVIVRLWGLVFFPFLGAKVVIEGPMPKHPFYLVCNHVTYLDPWLLNGLVGATFVAKGDVSKWPILGFLSKALHTIFVDRSSRRDTVRVNELIKHAMDMGDGLVVFAEGGISRGLDVEPFKSSLIQPAVGAGIPIHYAAISYRTHEGCPPASEIVGWWRPEPLMYHIRRLLRHRGFTATVRFGEEPIAGDDRKELARRLHEKVRELYEPMP